MEAASLGVDFQDKGFSSAVNHGIRAIVHLMMKEIGGDECGLDTGQVDSLCNSVCCSFNKPPTPQVNRKVVSVYSVDLKNSCRVLDSCQAEMSLPEPKAGTADSPLCLLGSCRFITLFIDQKIR